MSVIAADKDVDIEVRLRILETYRKKVDALEEHVETLQLRMDNINRIFWG